MLNRAGILNVYQYDDEVLDFGGGRLLLRGVNGSGKSTAMNMLLPFLLDADTRRIDAAGVQSGVLRTWMLTGRDEQQPVGYLWIELARGEAHLVFGCGIRANRSTDNVSTWWFITHLRPHIDVNLVDGRTPRSIDSLREALGPDSFVFTKDQRNAYRDELRHRLFGGADLEQHIRLLHVLRNPTVGDKIDTDLERYLDEALPQLSEQAIDDAAQPLEDLEEHRRNVAQLTATDEAIRALAATYSAYARGELRRTAGRASKAVGDVDALRREYGRRDKTAERASRALEAARAGVAATRADIDRLTSEIEALRDQPIYQEGKALEDLRGRVGDLARRVDHERRNVDRATGRRDDEVADEARAADVADRDRDDAKTSLADLRNLLDLHHIDATVADLGPIGPDDQGAPQRGAGDAATAGLGAASMAIKQRDVDLGEVRARIDALASATQAVAHLESTRDRAQSEFDAASVEHASATRATTETTTDLATAIGEWEQTAALVVDELGDDFDTVPTTPPDADLRGDRIEIRSSSATWVEGVQRLVSQQVLRAEQAEGVAADAVNLAQVELQQLLDRREPEPPGLAWQAPTDEIRLAALVDFNDDVPADDRLGLEAALEASGLLAATVRPGGLALATGDLVAIGGHSATNPLSDLLDVTLPEGHTALDADLVRKVLRSISTDFDSDAPTAVAADGRFRVGALAGRHRRDRVELIGVTARRAALERRRDAAREHLAEAERAHAEALAEVIRWTERHEAITALADSLPSTGPLDQALLGEEAALRLVDQRRDARDRVGGELSDAEQVRYDHEDDLRRHAASLQLPRTASELDHVAVSLAYGHRLVDRTKGALSTLGRSLDAWQAAHDRVHAANAALVDAEREVNEAIDAHRPLAARLATLEDSLGADYQRLLDALDVAVTDLTSAKDALPEVVRAVELGIAAEAEARSLADQAAETARAAELAVVDQLDRLRAALTVPGLLLSARGGPDGQADESPTPVVERSSAGVGELAEWIVRVTPEPDSDTNADSVRMALRRRRDTLGNGWDAEDRQPDPSLPLSVEVNGPEGRFALADAARVVSDRLHQQRSLLDAKQTQALRNLLQGLIAREIASKLGAAKDLVALMNDRLGPVETAHGIGVSLHWRRLDDLSDEVVAMIDLLSRPPDLRTAEDDAMLIEQISERIDTARAENPDAPYRDLIGEVLDYRRWHQMRIMLHRPNQPSQRLGRRTGLSEGEKKVVSYLPLFAAVAASYDALTQLEPAAPRFILLDDAFAKVSVDNHEKLFGLLVEMDLDFIATSERLWGTHASVPQLSITEVIRDADAGIILLEHARWNGTSIETSGHG